jgi:hypothetical protein
MREMQDLRSKSESSLLQLHYRVLDELKQRGLIRAAHAPLGEYAERLFCETFNWDREADRFNAGFDAKDKPIRFENTKRCRTSKANAERI